MNYTITANNLTSYYKCPWLLTKFRHEQQISNIDKVLQSCIKDIFIYQFIHEEWAEYKSLKTKWEKAIISLGDLSIQHINNYMMLLIDMYNLIKKNIFKHYNVIAIDMPCEYVGNKYIYTDKADVLLLSNNERIMPIHFCYPNTIFKKDNKIRFLNLMLNKTLNVDIENYWYLYLTNVKQISHIGIIHVDNRIMSRADKDLNHFLNTLDKYEHLPNTDYCDKCPCRTTCKYG